MSQAKVDRYKEEKANRKDILRKEQAKKVLRSTVLCLVLVVCAGYIAYSAIQAAKAGQSYTYTTVNVSSLENYLSDVTSAEE